MTAPKPAPHPRLLALLAAAGIAFALMAAKCETTTDFPPFVQEICTDNVDNDEDNDVDCRDSDCSQECAVEVVIFQPAATKLDSLRISGTHVNAATISVAVTPAGDGGQATLHTDGITWDVLLTNLQQPITYTVTATATSAKNIKDTAVVSFQRNQ